MSACNEGRLETTQDENGPGFQGQSADQQQEMGGQSSRVLKKLPFEPSRKSRTQQDPAGSA
jgi:hypothetical protein